MGEAKSLKSKWLIKFLKLYVPLSVHRARNILHMKKQEHRQFKPFENSP